MIVTAFLFGLLGSFHCVGMCGPIAFILPIDRSNKFNKITQISAYHLGRILAYSIIGFAVGLLGKSFQIFGYQQYLSIFVGVLMIVFVLFPTLKLERFSVTKFAYKYVSKLKSKLGSLLKQKNTKSLFTIGFLNGFLPCGLVYIAVFGALATNGNLFYGSAYMMIFGLGTIPLMTTAILLSNFITSNVKQKIRKAIPVFVVIIGLLFILRGLGLGIPYLSPKNINNVQGTYKCH